MDDAWHIKCSSTCPAPPSVPPPASFPTPPLPPPPLPPPKVSAPGSVNQMDMNSRQYFPPYIVQGSNLEDRPTIQEPLVFHTLNLDFAKSGKTELGNSFLALLSGHSHNLSSELSQLPNTRSALGKLHVHNGGIVVSGANHGVPVPSISSLSENHGVDSMWNGKISSYVESRPSLMSTSTKAPGLHNSLQIATSQCHGSGSAKPVLNQAFQGTNTGMAVSSMSCTWPIVSSPGNTSQHHTLNIQTSHKMPMEPRSSVHGHDSSLFRGRPRVFCMNTVGELFVTDMGLLSVLCFCHSLFMSVAKFCEHSGSSSVNPGEAVRLENGMTVARWHKLYFGNNALDDVKGWGCSDGPSSKSGYVGCRGSNFPTLSKNSETIDSVETFGGLGRSGEHWNKSVYANHPYTGVTQTALKNLANKDADNLYQRNRLEGHNHFFKSFTSSSQSPMPALAKNHTVQAVKESPDCMDLEASHSTLNKREQNVWPCLVPNSDNCKGNFGNPSISYPCSGTKKSFSHEYNISRGSIPSEASIVARDGRSSHIDLRLGQPSQHTHTSVSSFPTAINPLQFGAVCNSQKAQVNLPLTERTDYPRATKKPRPSLQCPPLEAPSSTRGQTQHAVGSINAFNHSETEEITGDATKNSLISLFLSHLNTEGSNSSQSTDILNNSKHFMTRVLDVDSVSAKCNLSERTSDVNDGYKRKYFLDGSDLYNNIDKEKGLRLADNESCNIVKASYMVHNKQTEDTRILTPAIGGHCLQSNSSVDDRQSSLNFNQPSSILQNGPDSRNSNQYGKVPFLGNRDHCNHAIHSSINPVSYATARPGLLNSGTPTSLTSPKSMYISEPTSALLQKKSIDLSQQLMDENMRFLALRHMVELSKQEQSTASVETSPRRQRLCCHSTMGLERYLCKDDLVAPGDLRQGTYCDIQQNATKFAVRSVHSCSNCYSSNVVGMLAAKPGTGGPNECCNCTALTQRISQCSKEYDIQLSTCHVCGADEHPCLRLRRISNDSPDSVKHMFNQKERSPSFSGKCCCTVLSKCLTGCCFSGGDNRSESINKQSVCGKTRINQVTPAYDKDHMFRDGKNIRLGRCECSKKHDVMKNDCQIGLWRDVPTKMIKHSDATLTDKPAQMLEGSRIAGDQLPDTASKEFDGTHQVPESMNEQQMSNICSGSSAPAVTDISVEVNNVNFCATNVEDTKSAYDFLVDEGSGIEKCGSSDEALGSRECEEALSVRVKVDPIKSGYCLPGHSSGDLIDKLRLESSYNKRRVRNQIYAGCAAEENINKIQPFERVWKGEKGKEPVKMNKLDISVLKSGFYPVNSESPRFISHSKWDFSSPKGIEAPPQPDNVTQKMCIFPGRSSSVKRKRSALSSTKPLSLKENHHNMLAVSDDQSLRTLTVAAEKEAMVVHRKKQFAKQEGYHLDAEKPPKYMSLNCIGNSHNHGTETVNRKVRPVVCGKSGIISNVGLSGQQKPAKIVSLSLILKKSKRCDINEYGGKPQPSLTSETKKAPFIANNGLCNELSSWELQRNNEDSSIVRRNATDSTIVLVSGKNKGCSSKNEDVDEFSMIERETGGGSNRVEKLALHRENYLSQTKPRYREARRCSLSKLLGKDKYAVKPSSVLNLGESNSSNLNGAGNQPQTSPSTATGMEHHCTKLLSRQILNYALSTNLSSGKDSLNNQDHAGELCQINTRRSSKVQKCQPFLLNSDAFCCVCGSSNKEHTNYLLECNRCLIKVHQACYGVSKIPRGYWFCRPCKTNSQNTVCVLCGYEGGAMTRAVKSRNIVKCLLKAWNVGTGSSFMESIPSSETVKNEFLELSLAGEASEYDNSGSVNAVRLTSSGAFSKAASDISSQIQTSTIRHSDNLPKNFQVYNTITAGVLDPSVTQWVHVVCGLWTPGTRCPNVDTMSAFDVSGASAARKNIVCSMCNRPGGSCIQCRVLNCSVHFHPWCAHQKGLLQSEIEGDDNEKVGFYGRCMLHATQNGFHGGSHSVDAEEGSPRKDWTCARTEGFKGRKSEEGFKPNHWKPYNDSGGCIVSQEQINAWLHINGQKSCTRAVVKQPCSDIEYDFRKEYFRYKQLKAWKHLVVYKSGIHALGLYTSQLIARGAMVVEYVGEIVGLRVADKREIEYQSGRRLQYKSACYFFRIDKEHIIDATRKGGIARFVNHSCLPNCVAKVISVRNEKKVVFFAERDINPGEEITYDYHFNSEDEGQKIPCFCNSKNCRRYLN